MPLTHPTDLVGLADLQARFQAHVLQPLADAATDALADVALPLGVPRTPDTDAPDATQRLGVYHHAYRARLLDTLRDTHSHTLAYLGDDWFDRFARAFIEVNPSTHANLRWYGQGFADWLAHSLVGPDSPVGDHPEVAELARLDAALRDAFDGPDAPRLQPAALAELSAEDWSTVVFDAHPTVRTLRMAHNTLALWTALANDDEVPPAQALVAPVDVLVWRHGEQPHFRSLDPAEAQAVSGLLAGQPWTALCEAAQAALGDAAEAAADQVAQRAGQWLHRWLQEGLLCAWRTEVPGRG